VSRAQLLGIGPSRIVVEHGAEVHVHDAFSLARLWSWTAASAVAGLGGTPDGGALVVDDEGRWTRLDASGRPVAAGSTVGSVSAVAVGPSGAFAVADDVCVHRVSSTGEADVLSIGAAACLAVAPSGAIGVGSEDGSVTFVAAAGTAARRVECGAPVRAIANEPGVGWLVASGSSVLRVSADGPTTTLLGDEPRADLLCCAATGGVAAISTAPRVATVLTLLRRQPWVLLSAREADIQGLALGAEALFVSLGEGVLARVDLASGTVRLAPRLDGGPHEVSLTAEVRPAARPEQDDDADAELAAPKRRGLGVLGGLVSVVVVVLVRLMVAGTAHGSSCRGWSHHSSSYSPSHESSPAPPTPASSPYRAGRAYSRMERAIRRYPSLVARFDSMSYAQARIEGAGLGALGLLRLSDAELMQLSAVRLRAMEVSTGFCASQWTGGGDARTVMFALDSLEQADLDAWSDLSARAMSLEAEGGPRAERTADAMELDRAVRAYLLTRPGDQVRWEANADLEAPSEDDACFLARTRLSAALALSPDQGGPLLRAIARAD
jgi:hypothetical protein